MSDRVEFLELAQMPLANHASGIPGLLHQFRHRDFVRMNPDETVTVDHLRPTRALRQGAGHEGKPRWRAAVGDIEAGELHALLAKTIDVRGGNILCAKAAEVTVTLVVGQHDNDIRLGSFWSRVEARVSQDCEEAGL